MLATTSLCNGDSTMYLELTFHGNRCDIVTERGHGVAVLNMKAFRSFTECQKTVYLRLQATVQLAVWSKQVSETGTAANARYCALSVLVFGYRHEAEVAAIQLAGQGFYLQDPDDTPPGFSYENPQCLELPTVHIPLDLELGRFSMSRAYPSTQPEFVHGNTADIDLDKILDTFACHSGLGQASAVAQVSTTLLRYVVSTAPFTNANLLLAIRRKVWTSFYNRNQTFVAHPELSGSSKKVLWLKVARLCMQPFACGTQML
jgi:SWI/SNF-related matrix-associated actin-dependent regulator of chromatin subfamily A3